MGFENKSNKRVALTSIIRYVESSFLDEIEFTVWRVLYMASFVATASGSFIKIAWRGASAIAGVPFPIRPGEKTFSISQPLYKIF